MECGVQLYCTFWYIYNKFYIIYYAVNVKMMRTIITLVEFLLSWNFHIANLPLFEKFWFWHDISFTIAWNISNYLENFDPFFFFFFKAKRKMSSNFPFLRAYDLWGKGLYIFSIGCYFLGRNYLTVMRLFVAPTIGLKSRN